MCGGLDDVFAYPCTRRDIREVFGEGVLDSATFGSTRDYVFERRETPGEISPDGYRKSLPSVWVI